MSYHLSVKVIGESHFHRGCFKQLRKTLSVLIKERISILLLSVHKQGPEDSRLHSINVVVDLLANDDRRATVSCQNHLCISAKTLIVSRSQLNWESWSFLG